MAAIVAVAVLVGLSGCAANPAPPPVVRVPVPAPCVAAADMPRQPGATPDAELARMDDYHLILRIAAERAEWILYGRQAGAALAACAR